MFSLEMKYNLSEEKMLNLELGFNKIYVVGIGCSCRVQKTPATAIRFMGAKITFLSNKILKLIVFT